MIKGKYGHCEFCARQETYHCYECVPTKIYPWVSEPKRPSEFQEIGDANEGVLLTNIILYGVVTLSLGILLAKVIHYVWTRG